MTEQLLEVAKKCTSALMQLCDDNINLLPMTCLHLMTVSALLSRCPRPSQDQWSNLGISKKQSKKKSGEGLKHMMVKAVQAFHDGLEGVLDKASSFQQWSQAGFSQEEWSKRKGDFSRASFCELVVNIFTILNEVVFVAELIMWRVLANLDLNLKPHTGFPYSHLCLLVFAFFPQTFIVYCFDESYDGPGFRRVCVERFEGGWCGEREGWGRCGCGCLGEDACLTAAV